eukprot:866554_1
MPKRVYSIACVRTLYRYSIVVFIVFRSNIHTSADETIKIYYENKCSFPNSMHPHSIEHNKTSEGAPYNDGSTDGDIWKARDSMVEDSPSSQMWIYHSHVDEPRDVMTGLLGVIIITEEDKDHDKYDLRLEDVHREFVTFFVLFYENESHLMDKNLGNYLRFSSTDGGADALLKYDEFYESNLMHSISGYLDCDQDDNVRWYTASFGDELDSPLSPHWHGHIAVDAQGHNCVDRKNNKRRNNEGLYHMKGIWLCLDYIQVSII